MKYGGKNDDIIKYSEQGWKKIHPIIYLLFMV